MNDSRQSPLGIMLTLGVLIALTLAAVPGTVAAQGDSGWRRIDPGGDTRCSWDTPFSFFVHDGPSDDLLIYFQGGGACWDGQSCSGTRYLRAIYGTDGPAQREGILNINDPENPFVDHDILFIPSCTGDVYTGSVTNEYTTGDGETITIYHQGYTNARAALDWAYTQYAQPDSVFIAGCSAGSLGSIIHAPAIIEHYQPAPVTHLGDGAGGYRGSASIIAIESWHAMDAIATWLPELANLTADTFAFERLFTGPAAQYPDVIFSQINRSTDPVQMIYVAALGLMPYHDALAENHAQIIAGTDSFRYYTAWGSGHCIVDSPDFYRMQTDGVRLRDWVSDLAAGNPVDDVQCTDCVTPEWYED